MSLSKLKIHLSNLIDEKYLAWKSHDYETCLMLKGAIIALTKIIKEIEKEDARKNV